MRTVGRNGQTMLEYLLAIAGVILIAGVMWYFVSAVKEQARRSAELMRYERV